MLETEYGVENGESDRFEMALRDVEVQPMQDGYHPMRVVTNRGNLDFRYYQVPGAKSGAIWVGGVGGGWDTPAKGLYPRQCRELQGEEIASLRVRYRYSTRLEESVLDVLAGIAFLESEGIEDIALIGHSFGGAVVIGAAAISTSVRTVVTLATQSYGAAVISEWAPECSILLLHGKIDRVLPPYCSEYVYQLAREPKRLILYDSANHGLDEVAEEVYQVIRDWMLDNLKRN